MFFALFGYWARGGGGGGRVSPKGWVHNLLMQFFALGSSKIEIFETYFFDAVTTHDDHPSYVKHVLGCIYVFFYGYWVFVSLGCALLVVESLRGGLAEGNRISYVEHVLDPVCMFSPHLGMGWGVGWGGVG